MQHYKQVNIKKNLIHFEYILCISHMDFKYILNFYTVCFVQVEWLLSQKKLNFLFYFDASKCNNAVSFAVLEILNMSLKWQLKNFGATQEEFLK